MATATINGKPSIYKSLSQPIETLPTYEARIADFTEIVKSMTEKSEPKTDAEWLNDPAFQAEYNAWLDSLDTPEVLEELDAWVSEQERIAIETEGEMTPEEEAEFEEYLCSQYDAEAEELAKLGCSARHAIAGHDLVWQAGGSV